MQDLAAGLTTSVAQPNRLRRDLRACIGEGAFFGGMVGFGETYVAAFVLAIGLGEVTAGMIGSVPLLAGGLMQMVSLHAVRLLGSHKRWVLICGSVQCLSFVPFFLAALAGHMTAAAALATTAVYWGAGLATGPAWNTWIETIVPRRVRARFFAARTLVSQLFVFVGFLGGGLWLQYAADARNAGAAFAALFAIAAACRLASVSLLAVHSEPMPIPPNMRRIPLTAAWRHIQAGSGGRLLLYLVAVQAAVQMAGPYFAPFMLIKLNLTYTEFAGLLSVAFLSKVAALPLCGRYAQRVGAWRLLWIGGIGIVPLSGGWIVSQNFAWLLLLQVVGGAVWAAYELAFFLLFFESIEVEERTSVLTFYNLLNTAAWVGGALLGGLVLHFGGTGYNTYLLVFGLSSLGRLLALGLLARVTSFAVESAKMGVRTMAVRADAASLDAPILPSLPDTTDGAEEGS
jgi:MFS family permease